MLVVVQFPIADARAFASGATARLDVPDWPKPRTFEPPQFVRRFGPAAERRRGPDAAWLDESAYCGARKAIRFPSMPPVAISGGGVGARLAPVCAFRRLLCDDSTAVVRVEVGIASSRRRLNFAQLTAAQLVSVVEGVLQLPTEVFDYQKGWVGAPLQIQGQRLSRLYAMASSRRRLWNDKNAGLRLVSHGRPLVVVEATPLEVGELPASARLIEPTPVDGTTLAFLYVASPWGPLPAWILVDRGAASPLARSLRLSLLRLHADHEVLDLVLGHLKAGRLTFKAFSDPGDRITSYLNVATRALEETRWHGIERSAVLAAYRAANSAEPEDSAALAGRLNGIRAQIGRKVQAYLITRGRIRKVVINHAEPGGEIVNNEGIIVHGDVTGGTLIARIQGDVNDSFNAFAAGSPAVEVEAAVRELKTQVDTLLPSLAGDEKTSKKAASAFKTLTEEAAKEDPVEEIVRGAGNALIAVGKTVQEKAQPIANAVHAVLGALKLVAVI